MFEVEMLPAREGDCLWIRYGEKSAPGQILIDAGRAGTYKDLRPRLAALPKEQRAFELLVITHIDRDHIEGALNLLEDEDLPVTFGQVWFNGYHHLKDKSLESFGAVQGERLTEAILKRKLAWNKSHKGGPVAVRKTGYPKIKLPGGMKLTLLSPDGQKLLNLLPDWEKECGDAGIVLDVKARIKEVKGMEEFGAIDVEALADSKFTRDATKPNGSSIAFIAEYGGKKALFGADAHEERLLASLKGLAKGKKPVPLDLFKVPHHGSERNISKDLLLAVDCPLYLISTNGSYFKHPNSTALARILKYGGVSKTIAFNYLSKFNEAWRNPALQIEYGYKTIFPGKKDNGTLIVKLD